MKKLIPILLLAGTTLLSGCGNSDNFVFTNTNNPVLSAPVCQDDAYSVNQDTTLTVSAANGVLANDTPNGGTATFATTSTQGGTVAGNADGSFTYTPGAGFAGADSFTYTVQNNAGSATCTVTITVIAVNGFFVDSVNGNDATGSFTGGMPFQTIQAAVAAAPENADIIVISGNYTGAVNLKNGQRLISASSTVNPQVLNRGEETIQTLQGPVVHEPIDPANTYFVNAGTGDDTTGAVGPDSPFATVQAAVQAAPEGADIVLQSGYYPGEVGLKNDQRLLGDGSGTTRFQVGATRPVLTGPVVLADGNTVDFLRVENSPGLGIDGDGQAGGVVTNCEIVNSAGTAGIQVRPGTGNWNVSNNTLTNNQQIGITFQTTGVGQMTVTVNNNTITGSGSSGLGFVTENTSQCNAQVHNNVMTGNQTNFTFEVLVGDTSQFCLDLENNQNDDVYRFAIDDAGAVVNIEELQTGPFSVPSNTGTITVVSGAGFTDPMSVVDGACGF